MNDSAKVRKVRVPPSALPDEQADNPLTIKIALAATATFRRIPRELPIIFSLIFSCLSVVVSSRLKKFVLAANSLTHLTLWIKRIPDGISEKIKGQHRDYEKSRRNEKIGWIGDCKLDGVGDQEPPGRIRWLDSKA